MASCSLDKECITYETESAPYALSIESALVMHDINYNINNIENIYIIKIDTCNPGVDLDQEILRVFSNLDNVIVESDEAEYIMKYLSEMNIVYITTPYESKIKIEWYSEDEISVEVLASLISSKSR